jgi:hypothetical protein
MQTNICDSLVNAQSQHLLAEEKAGEIGCRYIALAVGISIALQLSGIDRQERLIALLLRYH